MRATFVGLQSSKQFCGQCFPTHENPFCTSLVLPISMKPVNPTCNQSDCIVCCFKTREALCQHNRARSSQPTSKHSNPANSISANSNAPPPPCADTSWWATLNSVFKGGHAGKYSSEMLPVFGSPGIFCTTGKNVSRTVHFWGVGPPFLGSDLFFDVLPLLSDVLC